MSHSRSGDDQTGDCYDHPCRGRALMLAKRMSPHAGQVALGMSQQRDGIHSVFARSQPSTKEMKFWHTAVQHLVPWLSVTASS